MIKQEVVRCAVSVVWPAAAAVLALAQGIRYVCGIWCNFAYVLVQRAPVPAVVPSGCSLVVCV